MDCSVRDFDRESDKCNNCENYNKCNSFYMIIMENKNPTKEDLK